MGKYRIGVLLLSFMVILSGVPSTALNSTNSGARSLYAPNELLVQLKVNVTENDIQNIQKTEGFQLKHKFQSGSVWLFQTRSGDDLNLRMQSLRKNPLVELVEPNYIVFTDDFNPIDSRFPELWGMNNTGQSINTVAGVNNVDIDAPEAWEITQGDPAVVVAVIDTGIDISHPDLEGNIWKNPGEIADGIDNDNNGYVDDITGWDFVNKDNMVFDPATDGGHGTHVAGTIAASANEVGVIGVAPNVKIMPLKFIGPNGGYISDAILALDYAQAKGVRISNNSWSGGGYSTILTAAITRFKGIFVAAAGNYSTNTDSSATYPASYTNANILSVAAVDNTGNLASFSNYGLSSVDVGAPGVFILSTTPENTYSWFSGTSMAAPHVSGIAALLLSKSPNLTTADVISLIKNNGTPLNSLAGKTVTGRLVNARKALMALSPPPPLPAGPIVVSTSPLNNARNVFLTTTITITFDKNVIADVSKIVITGGNTTVSFNSDLSDAKMTLTPTAKLRSKTIYTVVIGASSVKDSVGVYQLTPYTFSFKTR